MAEYTKASDLVLRIARELIEEFHPWLEEAMIGFLFRDEAQVSKGKITLATAKKAPRWIQPYADLDFLIIIAKDQWNLMTTERARALIDHELCHCCFVEGTASIWAHDFEEFHQIIERHGLWTYDLIEAGKKFETAQPTLKGFEAPKTKGKVLTIEKVITTDPEK